MQSNTNQCPECGEALAENAPRRLCPKCLLNQGLESTITHGFEDELSAESARGSSRQLRPGENFGDYEIGRLLGKGGMGTVYEAEHLPSGRTVALKVLGHKLSSQEHRSRFLREGRLAASINHPNNVYIYGTDEIDGTPVISMELATGGTLQDRVKNEGPLSIGEAVDVILDIIAGLDAALSVGILHRDIKPANCFIDADGNVKVGDFGLSISTEPRGDTNLTETGVFLGTPAFSSPEQLRGDELDVPSDIYSVGVTLYFLLTGQTPFHAKQLVQFLATVLERPAPSPRNVRSEIPKGLAKIVLRCLAKQSKDRFTSYDELRGALRPYTSEAPAPGTVGFRFLANGIDGIVLLALGALLPLLWVRSLGDWSTQFNAISDPGPEMNAELMVASGIGILLQLFYYSIMEGIWGATVGKAICRLRVLGSDREKAGFPKALLRACIFLFVFIAPWWILYVADPKAGIEAHAFQNFTNTLTWIPMAVTVAGACLLFCTMRRRSGYAGLHELWSGTRVLRLHNRQRRPTLAETNEPLPDLQTAEKIGRYDVLGELDADESHAIILGYDRRLLRRVWIRKTTDPATALSSKLRNIGRIGRLRWLNGETDGEEAWDAFEAPTGRPLLDLIDEPQPWDAVRFWLLDLAEELDVSRTSGPFPDTLGLDRVWITAEGRAKILDFRAPGLDANKHKPSAESTSHVPDPKSINVFLKRVAYSALEGIDLAADDDCDRELAVAIPVSARQSLIELGSSEKPELPLSQFRSFIENPAAVSDERRVGTLVACLIIPFGLLVSMLPQYQLEAQFLRQHPAVGKLSAYADYYQSLSDSDAELSRSIEIFTADRFRSTINDMEVWSDPISQEFVDKDTQALLQRFVKIHPNPTEDELAAAKAQFQLHRYTIDVDILSTKLLYEEMGAPIYW